MTDVTPPDDAPLSFADYARRRGCSRPLISKKVADGTIHGPALTADRRIIPSIADAQLAAARDPSQSALTLPAAGEDAVNYARERARREAALAERAEIELRQRKGELLDRAATLRAVEDAVRAMRDRILTIPHDIAGELARLSDEREIEQHLRARLNAVLNALHMEFGANG
jgi:hypothetical protein